MFPVLNRAAFYLDGTRNCNKKNKTNADDTRSRNFCQEFVPETCIDTRDQNCVISLVGCVWKFLYQKLLSNTADQSNCTILVTCVSTRFSGSGTSFLGVCHLHKVRQKFHPDAIWNSRQISCLSCKKA